MYESVEKNKPKISEFDSSVKPWFGIKRLKKHNFHYPCLCEAIGSVLFWNRLIGILPVVALKSSPHVSCCKFEVSKWWLFYCYVLQFVFIPYSITSTILRMACGPERSSGSDWYVMTFGYFISDVDATIVLTTGVAYAREMCKILEDLTAIPGPIGEMCRLKKIMKISMILILGGFLAVFVSFTYVAWIRFETQPQLDLYCHMLDKPFGVMIRGFTLIFPGIHISLIVALCLLVSTKFQRLGDRTTITLEGNIGKSCHNNEVATNIEYNIPSATDQGLNQLAETYKNITVCLERINKCIGLQVLAEVSTNLYTIVYYLYRYCTASNETIGSNNRERGHYIIALGYRIAKLLVYITLGHVVSTSSTRPLEALQKARIINLPTRLQQQVQSLILQWSGKRMALAAFEVVQVGPWLIAPIVGNVITYLLVALQFEKPASTGLSANVTAILETIF